MKGASVAGAAVLAIVSVDFALAVAAAALAVL